MKATQNLRISLSDLPFGSKSAPPLPPPMFTRQEEVSHSFIDQVELKLESVGILTASQSILEDLLEAQEFEDGQIHRGVKAKTSLVGTQSRVELHTISSIDLYLSLVILPNHSKLNDSFGDGSDLEGGLVFRVLFEEGGVFEG